MFSHLYLKLRNAKIIASFLSELFDWQLTTEMETSSGEVTSFKLVAENLLLTIYEAPEPKHESLGVVLEFKLPATEMSELAQKAKFILYSKQKSWKESFSPDDIIIQPKEEGILITLCSRISVLTMCVQE